MRHDIDGSVILLPLSSVDTESMVMIDKLATAWPWSLAQYQESFRVGDKAWGLFAETDSQKQLLAFAIYQLVLDECTLLNLVVHPDWQRRGLARQLLQHSLSNLHSTHNMSRCLLEVRESNLAAIQLYQQTGFAIDGQRKNYYPAHHGRETAILMSAVLPLMPQR